LEWHGTCIVSGADPEVGSEEMQRGSKMFIATIRETATIFAGAFLSAMLLVSAATSLPFA
jgi:hypothetical protein